MMTIYIPRIIGSSLLALGLFATACTSDYAVKEVDTELESKGNVGTAVIGLNNKDEVIIQDNRKADAELTDLIFDNNRFESEIKYEYYEIKRCRRDRADPRLGGNGETVSLPRVDFNRPTPSTEELGLDKDGNLVIVKRSQFKDRLKNEREKNENLRSLHAKVKEMKDDCEIQMGQARVKAGLPSERFQGQVEVHSDGTIKKTINAHEKNLDDAFRIMRMKEKRENKSH